MVVTVRLPWHAEEALGDDVALDLDRAAHDRGAAREEEVVLEVAGPQVAWGGAGELGVGALDRQGQPFSLDPRGGLANFLAEQGVFVLSGSR